MDPAYILAVLTIATLVLNYFDIASTEKNFSLGGGEANWFMKVFQTRFGKFWWIPKTLIVLAIYAMFWLIELKGPSFGTYAILFPAGMGTFVYALTVKQNYAVMKDLGV